MAALFLQADVSTRRALSFSLASCGHRTESTAQRASRTRRSDEGDFGARCDQSLLLARRAFLENDDPHIGNRRLARLRGCFDESHWDPINSALLKRLGLSAPFARLHHPTSSGRESRP